MRADARRNYDLLLAAAGAAFAEHGMEASLEDIARRAGCTKGTIFLYFDSKQELFKALVRRTIPPVIETGESMLEQHDGAARDLMVKLLIPRFDYMTRTADCERPKRSLA